MFTLFKIELFYDVDSVLNRENPRGYLEVDFASSYKCDYLQLRETTYSNTVQGTHGSKC